MKQRPYKFSIGDYAAAVLRTLHPHIKKKMRAAFEAILIDPHAGKALREELSGLRSYRVSRYRVIYRISRSQQIEIIAVGPRERIYEETYRLITKSEK